tara:strand:- start:2931 stop:3410 length:480 start_codon:yes stop_codon:yes gene_type:complete
MTWFNIIKRKRGPPKDKPPNIMGGERLPEGKRVKGIEEGGQAPEGNKRVMGRGIELPKTNRKGKQLIEAKKVRRGSGKAREGEVRYGDKNYTTGKQKKISGMPINTCAKCKTRFNKRTRKKSPYGTERYCIVNNKCFQNKYPEHWLESPMSEDEENRVG